MAAQSSDPVGVAHGSQLGRAQKLLSAWPDAAVRGGRRRGVDPAPFACEESERIRGTHRDGAAFVRSLLEGVRRYETTKRRRYSERFAALAHGQEPVALFITCSDSRVVPSLVSLANPGELFVVRNVANIVPPHAAGDTGDASVASAVWYALEVLQIRDVVVCGHSGCGGVKALLGAPPQFRPLQQWLAPAARAVETWREHGPLDASFPDADQVSQISTLQQLENLETHEHVRKRVDEGSVCLHAWWFDIPTARLLAYSKDSQRYVPIMEAFDELAETAAE